MANEVETRRRASPKRKAYLAAFKASGKKKAAAAKYDSSPKGKVSKAKYRTSLKGKACQVRYLENVQARLAKALRVRLNQALRRGWKAGSAVSDLGCTITELRAHLESLWEPGMSWENWGRGPEDWSIDHIKPLASFDLTDREQFLRANHYSNLRPMWHALNMKKGAR